MSEYHKDAADRFIIATALHERLTVITGDEKILGKPVGSDEKNHKTTYVSLYGLAAAQELARKTVDEALGCLEMFGERADALRGIAKMITDRKA